MAEDSDLERTEPPSGRRLDEARAKGQIPRSQELVTFAVVMGGLIAFLSSAPDLFHTLSGIMRAELNFDHATLANPKIMGEHFTAACRTALMACLPVFATTALAAIAAPLLIGGWLFTFETLAPNFARMNPMSGIARMFSVRALVEMSKAILKSGLIGGVAAAVIWHERDQFLQLINMPPDSGLLYLWQMIRFTLLLVAGSMIIIVAIDVPYQLWDYTKGLRMTKEEVKQEAKESEGDPQVKGRIRQLQREAARKRMMSEIPKADVVVTNPTHYAVALRYTEEMRAPIVVAKGAFLLAERIIDIARDNKISVVRTPPFARALYHHTELGEEIPAALYTAAAEVLAYIYQLKQWHRHGGEQPQLNDDLPVPGELDPGGVE
ncbi:flagellar biosynthetic protein FlhB [Andreprevotia lacus DSM 23236]|jgi:flagellar biosynthetic protein FlhB|uniref:Flagellar biosynthetic protein FlhB n=1 Tax=Andreprevotia lacus DSM 23236 TaxID=1121001 RepID=A0A1W1XQC9_9NEIS|nr:flagellar biosynthesis protein FlhB [Andreprevotia lacus]SMC26173.1 flagellar biosynthetic protein FlhB [Andreprevotia lacus DSM 23236]